MLARRAGPGEGALLWAWGAEQGPFQGRCWSCPAVGVECGMRANDSQAVGTVGPPGVWAALQPWNLVSCDLVGPVPQGAAFGRRLSCCTAVLRGSCERVCKQKQQAAEMVVVGSLLLFCYCFKSGLAVTVVPVRVN